MQAYDIVKLARQTDRISTLDVIEALTDDFIFLHGDRLRGDDHAMIGGVGRYGQQTLTVIGLQKGKSTSENIKRNFGSSGPSGYRKAIRLMKQAEKFKRPVLTLINTAGADATPESEDGGIGSAIAECLLVMADLTVPTLAIILGEGGSGGAIALAYADEVWMLENSIYSILSPEAFATILWKNNQRAQEASEAMKMFSDELKELKVIEKIIPETKNNQLLSNQQILDYLIPEIKQTIQRLLNQPTESLLEKREARFRQF